MNTLGIRQALHLMLVDTKKAVALSTPHTGDGQLASNLIDLVDAIDTVLSRIEALKHDKQTDFITHRFDDVQ